MKQYLHYRAGSKILELIRSEGLRPGRIKVFAGAAGGPKWFVCVGFDRALMRSRFLERGGGRVLLVGASAGAWRCLAMAGRNPLDAYELLRVGYSRNTFSEEDTPATISAAFKKNVDAYLLDDEIEHILNHDVFDLAIHTVRSRGPAASANPKVQAVGLLLTASMNLFSPAGMRVFFERVIFFSGPNKPQFLAASFRGRAVRLTPENVRQVGLATGSLPYLMSGVNDIPGAPEGVYRDGGLVDYQINQDYHPPSDGIVLFFHYQERIVPGWFDKKLTWRNPPRGSLDQVLQIYPGDDFVALLPDKKLPDRNDFIEFVRNPEERIRRWDEASEKSEILGEQFMEDVESGRIRELVKPLR